MTDRDRWIDFLDAFGIHWEDAATYTDGNNTDTHTIYIPHYGGEPDLGHNHGYSGFYADIEFDADGYFVKIGIWE